MLCWGEGMSSAIGSLPLTRDQTLRLSMCHFSPGFIRVRSFPLPLQNGFCNARCSSTLYHTKHWTSLALVRQSAPNENGRCLLLHPFSRTYTSHRKTFKRILVTVSESQLRPWTSTVGEAVRKSSNDRFLQVVLHSPQIPGNTGCVARTCAASAVGLHLIEPLGFQIDDTKLKRAGLDYWPYVVVKVHSSWSEFLDYFKQQEGQKRLLAFTKRGETVHTDMTYKPGDWLVFGSEPSGLPPEVLADCANEVYGGRTIRIPILETYVRCLNLSVCVGIAVYEASRQLGYEQFHDVSSDFIESEVNGKALTSTEL